jgi:hypothetical protein
MIDCTKASSKYNFECELVEKKGRKAWRQEILAKLKHDALKQDIMETLIVIDDPRAPER